MTKALETRIHKLEQDQGARRTVLVSLERPDETGEQARARHLASHPGDADAEVLAVDTGIYRECHEAPR